MDFGDWDGKSFEELKANDPVLFSKIWRQPHRYSPPNGEPFTDFSARIGSAWEGLIKQHGGKHILLICHGGVIRALLGHIMETPLTALSRIEVPYACLSRVKVHHQQGKDHWPTMGKQSNDRPSSSGAMLSNRGIGKRVKKIKAVARAFNQ